MDWHGRILQSGSTVGAVLCVPYGRGVIVPANLRLEIL